MKNKLIMIGLITPLLIFLWQLSIQLYGFIKYIQTPIGMIWIFPLSVLGFACVYAIAYKLIGGRLYIEVPIALII